MKKTLGLVEQHIHGAFGCDFMNCSAADVIETAEKLMQCGVGAFFPTLMTDDIEKIKERIEVIKEAKAIQPPSGAKIAGIHLEGPFINPEKAGIHPVKYIQPLDLNIYSKIDDEIIKIVTLAPELDCSGKFTEYLKSKKIKVSAGHCLGADFSKMEQVTHLYNAMGAFSHRGASSVVSALTADLYTEVIADSMHVCDEVLKITFKQKPLEKILLISDALPLAHADFSQTVFAGEKIYNKNGKLVNDSGVIAGSAMLLCDIVKNLADKNILPFGDAITCASLNQLNYHNLENRIEVLWDDDNNISDVKKLK